MEREASTDTSNATMKASGKSSKVDTCDDEETVVKFISRSCFDQTKGSELLRKVARQDTYDSTLVDEYILSSSAHAVLHYAQVTLGAVAFARHSLDVRVHTGGHNHNKMEIDRSTILQLELLTNNSNSDSKSSRKESLLSTVDCTKTGVGHRLLRTTLMAPPCRYEGKKQDIRHDERNGIHRFSHVHFLLHIPNLNQNGHHHRTLGPSGYLFARRGTLLHHATAVAKSFEFGQHAHEYCRDSPNDAKPFATAVSTTKTRT